MTEDLYADPEGIRSSAQPYAVAAQDWESLRAYVEGIRTRYYGAWGDDDLGNKFGPNFVVGLEAVEAGVGNLGKTLLYYSEGLVENGQIYGDARDDADEASYAWLAETDQLGHSAPTWASKQAVTEEQQPVFRRAMAVRAELLPGEVTEGQVFRRSVHANAGELTEGTTTRPAFRMRAVAMRAEPGEPLQPTRGVLASRRLAVEGEAPLQPAFVARRRLVGEPIPGTEPLQPAFVAKRMRAGELMPGIEPLQPAFATRQVPGEPMPGIEPLHPLQPMQAPIPRAVAVDPPPGQVWSDGHWLYSNGNPPMLLNDLDSPYQHGSPAMPYEPGTIPQPARGPLPPSGEFWSDGVYVYSSDHGVLAIDQLDSPYDFT
jgi:hypothetical protein